MASFRRRRVGSLALGTFLALLAFEVVLQVVSYGVWLARAPVAGTGDAGTVVLCVGDSFTYGFGVSDASRSYPRCLERELGRDFRVVNVGWPGNASDQVLRSLPRQLDVHRPAIVCVLIGVNDFWRDDGAREGAAPANDGGGEGFRIELRTWKLLQLIGHWLEHGHGPATSAAAQDAAQRKKIIGEWHAGGLRMKFLANGRVETDSDDLTWSLRGEELVLHYPAEDAVLAWRRDGDVLEFEGGPFAGKLRFTAGPPDHDAVDRGRAALRAGEFVRAEELFRACVVASVRVLEARQGLVEVLARTRIVAAREEVAALERDYAANPSPELGEVLARSAFAVGDAARAVAVAAQLVAVGPVRESVLSFLTVHALEASDTDGVVRAYRAALAREPDDAMIRARLWLSLSDLLQRTAPVDAMVALLEGWRVHRGDDSFQHTVLSHPDVFTPAAFAQALERMTATDAERTAMRTLFDAALAARDTTDATLDANLRRIVALTRAAGAEPLLLVYPMHRPRIETIHRRIANATGTTIVDVRAAFDRALENADWGDYFILDGHPSERGYALMADTIAAAIR